MEWICFGIAAFALVVVTVLCSAEHGRITASSTTPKVTPNVTPTAPVSSQNDHAWERIARAATSQLDQLKQDFSKATQRLAIAEAELDAQKARADQLQRKGEPKPSLTTRGLMADLVGMLRTRGTTIDQQVADEVIELLTPKEDEHAKGHD